MRTVIGRENRRKNTSGLASGIGKEGREGGGEGFKRRPGPLYINIFDRLNVLLVISFTFSGKSSLKVIENHF